MATPSAPNLEASRLLPAVPRPALSLASLLTGWAASTAWTVVLLAALLDSDWRRGSILTAAVAGAALLTLGAVVMIARDVIATVLTNRRGDERYWAGYADCARALLGERQPPEPGGSGLPAPRQTPPQD